MKYCLIGKKLSHSYSKVIHTRFGLDYSLQEVGEDNLSAFLTNCQFDGFNVTIPYKKDVLPFLAKTSELALRAGAVNTVKNQNGKLFGYNTDYYGFIGALDRCGVSVKGKNVMVLGSGGASNVVCVALNDLKAKSVTVISRKGAANYDNCYGFSNTEIIVNATPVGMYPDIDACPLDLSCFERVEFVYDLVYNPHKTKLLCIAQKLGIKNANGLSMLVIQALKAREIWENLSYSESDVTAGINAVKSQTLNIALTGMPSSGKSTIGKQLAAELGKEFIDTDKTVYELTGKTPEQIINEDGEPTFRDVEKQAVKLACSSCGAVIALGGGAVLKEENRNILKQTAFTVYVKRPLEWLSKHGRPTLQRDGAAALYEKRKTLYESVCDFSVNNDKTIQNAVKEIITGYENFDN